MSVMVDHPTAYFSRWIADRSTLLQRLESEAAHGKIPIVGPVVGQLLYLLARMSSARHILEFGTATGYSAIFMGAACRQNQGQLISLEIDPEMAGRARKNVAEAGLSNVVDIRCQDALSAFEPLERLMDMVFMDVEKQDYVKLLPLCDAIIKPNGLLVADNTGFKDAHDFNQAIHAASNWASVNLWALLPGHSPETDGICIALKLS